ncbi:MAG: hypothetical protein KF678_12800 [Phycisphaeraceae bacterium]|nr:hypothetical protein [Phycisphaeraceae bacterium]
MVSLRNERNRKLVGGAAVLLIAVAGTAASAQPKDRSSSVRREAIPIALDRVDHLYVSPRGPVSGPFTGSVGRSCNIIATHTDASFTGGSYTLQAGFAQSEMAGMTYTVPASEWPIKINMTEFIVATSATNQTTTTKWSMLYYQGTPTNGTLVATYSSDDVILPHIVLPPGTNGVNVTFSIDPNDPEQLIIQNNGSNQFTVAFRIDQHHNQTQNPCTTAPPTNSNAFPTTDVSGLAASTANWLFGVNCGILGCPSNGGWSTFANLISLCRPTGDWVSRTTWSSVLNCTPGVGACCLPSGQCVTAQTPANCSSQGGTYRGDGSTCASPCPQPNGACCFTGGSCLSLSSADCTTAGGTWLGGGTTCAAGNTCPTGACCLPDGQCLTGVTSLQCTSQGGTFRGTGTNCSNPCPQPTGACCLSSGGCLTLTQSDCGVIPGTSWAGPLTSCATACTPPCYANCDGSTGQPRLTANDFQCFLNKFAASETYANCDGSTGQPSLTANDFQCFLNKFAAGCS